MGKWVKVRVTQTSRCPSRQLFQIEEPLDGSIMGVFSFIFLFSRWAVESAFATENSNWTGTQNFPEAVVSSIKTEFHCYTINREWSLLGAALVKHVVPGKRVEKNYTGYMIASRQSFKLNAKKRDGMSEWQRSRYW